MKGNPGKPDLPGSPGTAEVCRAGRLGKLEEVASDVSRKLAAGEALDVEEVARGYPDLMPELGEYLRDVALLYVAREKAVAVPCASPPDTWDATLMDELEVLRKSLTKYEIIERVRYGGQGVVYRARQHGNNRIVAVKVLLDGPLASAHQRHRFEREIELISRLRHPNIVTVYDSGVVRGRNFYAMEFIEGQSIDDYVLCHDLSPREIVGVVIKVAQAVHHAHQHGIIHRDLNPSNILVDEEGEPRIYDFGLAKDLWSDGAGAAQSMTGLGVGTLPYLSPEQIGGSDGRIDVRSDVYAVGLVLYELLTDMFPYPIKGEASEIRDAILATEPMPLRKAITHADPDCVPGLEAIDRDLETILTKVLAKAKEERYQSAAEFADDLERWLAGDAVHARTDSALYRVRKTVRKHLVLVTIVATVMAAFVVSSTAVTISWWHVRAQRDEARAAARTAYDLFEIAVTEVEEAVSPLPGGVSVRKRLIRSLEARIPELEALVESDEMLDPILTRLMGKQGNIAEEYGRRDEARRYYKVFLEKSRAALETGESNDAMCAQVIRGYRQLATVSDNRTRLFQEGGKFGKSELERNPGYAESCYELGKLYLAYAHFLRDSADYDKSLREFERTLELGPNETDVLDTDARWARTIAKAMSGQGLVLRERGEHARGTETLERALRLRGKIVEKNPPDTTARYELLSACIHMGKIHRDAGDIELAMQYLRDATRHADILEMMDPHSLIWDYNKHCAYRRLALLYLETGDLEEAWILYQRAKKISDRLKNRNGNAETRSLLSHTLMLQGRIQRKKEEWEEAFQSIKNALAIRRELLEAEPMNLARMIEVASATDYLASCARNLKQVSRAVELRRNVYVLKCRIAKLQPHGVGAKLSVIRAQVNLAAVCVDLDTVAGEREAEELLAEAESGLQELQSTGKLKGREREYKHVCRAIQSNRDKLNERAVDTDGYESDQQ